MIISLSPETIAELIHYPAQIFSDLWVFIALALGLNMGFYIIENIIWLFNFDEEKEDDDEYHEDDEGNVVGKLPHFVVEAQKRKGDL
jgi:hypothetical protein